MKHTILIKASEGTSGGWLKFDKIRSKGYDWCITKDWQVVRRDLLKASDEPMMLRVTPESSFSFNYDETDKENRNYQRKLMADLIPYHHQVITKDFRNPNAGAAMLFEYEDLAMNDKRNYKALAMEIAATNKAWEMNYKEKLDVMYYYGENPVIAKIDGTVGVMDHKQVAIRLCERGIGLVLRRTIFENNAVSRKTFVEHFVEDYKPADPQYVLKTNILKAFALKGNNELPILMRSGNIISLGEEIIGSTVDECIVWFNNNKDKKKFLFDMVRRKDVIDADNLDEVIDEPTPQVSVMEDKKNEQEIREEAKKLKVELWWHPNKIEDVERRLIEARPIWKEAENFGLLPKIEGMKKPSLEKIQSLIAEKKKELQEAV